MTVAGRPFITFEVASKAATYTHFKVTKTHNTVKKIAVKLGHPEMARAIADLNGIRSVKSKLGRKSVKVPGSIASPGGSFSVMMQDNQAPTVTDGYANFSTVDRPGRVGVTVFDGYNPIQLSLPIQFENFAEGEGVDIERDIALLERYAGRGKGSAAGVGSPPVVSLKSYRADGKYAPLIPENYQETKDNQSAPKFVIASIDWDTSPLRNSAGNRVRQLATVVVQQFVELR